MIGQRRRGSLLTGHPGLHTDLYELRMVQSYVHHGMTADATFSLFIRPAVERPWYVALGIGRALDVLDELSFGPEELAYLEELGIGAEARAYLADLPTRGEVWAVPEGTIVLAQEPVFELTAPMPVAQLLETAIMNVVHYPTLVATKAARCALVAGGARLADFGFRRAHGIETGIDAAVAAHLGGGFATSNVEAARRYGLPATGTMAHSFVQAHLDEREAFRAFAQDHAEHSVLLVDTYDTVEGVRRAIEVCQELGIEPKGVRLDSGDLGALAEDARRQLDAAGFERASIIASGGVDEYAIHELLGAGAPIDGFGVGTALAVSQDHPGLDIVYKLVAYDDRPVAKFSGVKSTFPGAKQVHRPDGDITRDVVTLRGAEPDAGPPLLAPVWRDGERIGPRDDLEVVRARVVEGLERLPAAWRAPPYVDQAPVPVVGDALRELGDEVRRRAFDRAERRPASECVGG